MALNGIAVHALFVNGDVVAHGVIAGTVRIVDGTVVNGNGGDRGPNSDGALVGGGVGSSGALVGGGVSPTGALVGGGVSPTGALVGGGVSPTGALVGGGVNPTGALVGGGSPCVEGAVVVNLGGGTANGGMLTGEGITVNDGIITGENLVLTGARIHGGSVNAGGGSVQVSPAG